MNFCFSCAADKPTFNQLLVLKKADGSAADSLRVIQWISSSEQYLCEDFASLLLNDPVKVKKHQRDSKDNADKFIRAVLKDWLSCVDGDPAVPSTWEDLAQCVTDAGLDGTLAKAIRDAYTPDPGNYFFLKKMTEKVAWTIIYLVKFRKFEWDINS